MNNLSAQDFYKKCTYNSETRNQMWMSCIADSHDSWCNCDTPFAHLLASIFPPGHTDRTRTIQEILTRDFRKQCLSGGGDAENSGMAANIEEKENHIKEERKEEFLEDQNIEDLLAAVADAEGR
ncbi:hypothetical protein TTMidiV_gp2 [Torque teno midi virus 1]|nr:hypothetical protein TTMidiV_gp2 [Torque teno midi virus 1]BAF49422.1 hypothetical protein [Torque teno midi virus 1]